MSSVWATFTPSHLAGVYIRQNTRLYYHHTGSSEPSSAECVGVVFMCNPATPKAAITTSARSRMVLDPTLGKVMKVIKAAEAIKQTGSCTFLTPGARPQTLASLSKKIPYLKVLNLFYSTGSDDFSAWKNWLLLKSSYGECIPPTARFVWCAWGGRPSMPSRTNIRAATTATLASHLPNFGTFGTPGAYAIAGIHPPHPHNPRHPLAYTCSEMRLIADQISLLI